jgi:hypothetical protein
LLAVSAAVSAQTKPLRDPAVPGKTEKAKPFKVLTNGRQITIQSKENIRTLMIWSAGGQRIVEEKDINSMSYSFVLPQKEKIVFVLVEMLNGKRFTEKIGVQ